MKLTAKQFFIEQFQEGKCKDITTNPEPELGNAFFNTIYRLMEEYAKHVIIEEIKKDEDRIPSIGECFS